MGHLHSPYPSPWVPAPYWGPGHAFAGITCGLGEATQEDENEMVPGIGTGVN